MKCIFGIVIGITGTLFCQHMYKNNQKFRSAVNATAKEFGLKKPNFFDKCSNVLKQIYE